MSKQHLIHEGHSTIDSLKSKNRSNTEIAAIINRHRTKIWRELKRNSNSSGTYTAPAASKTAAERAAQASCRASRIAPERWGRTCHHFSECFLKRIGMGLGCFFASYFSG